jgi:hypothetical protein
MREKMAKKFVSDLHRGMHVLGIDNEEKKRLTGIDPDKSLKWKCAWHR